MDIRSRLQEIRDREARGYHDTEAEADIKFLLDHISLLHQWFEQSDAEISAQIRKEHNLREFPIVRVPQIIRDAMAKGCKGAG